MLILLFGLNSQILAQKRSEKEYEKIEKIITQGRIIHKERETMFHRDTPKNLLNLNTFERSMWTTFYLYLLIDYKDKLYSCQVSQKGSLDFWDRDSWLCFHIFEKPEE